jgi:hypothetical protein
VALVVSLYFQQLPFVDRTDRFGLTIESRII